MATIKLIINIAAIILSIYSAYMVYLYSPQHFDVINANFDWEKGPKETKRKNDRLKTAFYLLISSSVLQIITNFLP